MKFLAIFGRIIYAITLIIFGVLNFMKANLMAHKFLKGWPIADGLVYVAGLGLILAGISIIINVQARMASLLLALLLLIFILALHVPAILAGDSSGIALGQLLKDSALLGAALTYAGTLKN